jgi:ATP-binding cassette subfamily F protein uup
MQQLKNSDSATRSNPKKNNNNPTRAPSTPKTNKLSYQEQRELESLPDKIDVLENQQSALTEALSASNLYQDAPDQARKLNDELQQISAALDKLMERWASLEA